MFEAAWLEDGKPPIIHTEQLDFTSIKCPESKDGSGKSDPLPNDHTTLSQPLHFGYPSVVQSNIGCYQVILQLCHY